LSNRHFSADGRISGLVISESNTHYTSGYFTIITNDSEELISFNINHNNISFWISRTISLENGELYEVRNFLPINNMRMLYPIIDDMIRHNNNNKEIEYEVDDIIQRYRLQHYIELANYLVKHRPDTILNADISQDYKARIFSEYKCGI